MKDNDCILHPARHPNNTPISAAETCFLQQKPVVSNSKHMQINMVLSINKCI